MCLFVNIFAGFWSKETVNHPKNLVILLLFLAGFQNYLSSLWNTLSGVGVGSPCMQLPLKAFKVRIPFFDNFYASFICWICSYFSLAGIRQNHSFKKCLKPSTVNISADFWGRKMVNHSKKSRFFIIFPLVGSKITLVAFGIQGEPKGRRFGCWTTL